MLEMSATQEGEARTVSSPKNQDSRKKGELVARLLRRRTKPLEWMSAVAILVFLAVALFAPKRRRQRWCFVAGGVLGFCGSFLVVVSFLAFDKFRAHPQPLLFYRSLVDMVLGIYFATYPLTDGIKEGGRGYHRRGTNSRCSGLGFWIEFFECASEAWLAVTIFDLAISLHNPLIDTKSLMTKYHRSVWSFAMVMALVFTYTKSYGHFYVGGGNLQVLQWYCFFRSSKKSYPSWSLFYIPVTLLYCLSMRSLVDCWRRLKNGLPSSFETRVRAIAINNVMLIANISYWMLWSTSFFFSYILLGGRSTKNIPDSYALSSSYGGPRWKTSIGYFLSYLAAFLTGAKGYVDFLVWVTAHDHRILINKIRKEFWSLRFQDSSHSAKDQTTSSHSRRTRRRRGLDRNKRMNTASSTDLGKKVPVPALPAVSTALKTEFLHYLTDGMRSAARYSSTTSSSLSATSSDGGFTRDTKDDKMSLLLEQRESERLGPMTISHLLRLALFSSYLDEMAPRKKRVSTTNHDDDAASDTGLDEEVIVTSELAEVVDSEEAAELRAAFTSSRNVLISTPMPHQHNGAPGREPSLRAREEDVSERPSFVQPSLHQVRFVDYATRALRKVRDHFGVDPDTYEYCWRRTAKERVTEGGASGAFFFFSADERFIAKSCTAREMERLRLIADDYEQYVAYNPNTFLCRIYGAHCLELYGQRYFFMVQENLFAVPEKLAPQRRYDIKGSWIDRHAGQPRTGQLVSCVACNQKYIYVKDAADATNSRVGKKRSFASGSIGGISGRHRSGPATFIRNHLKRNKNSMEASTTTTSPTSTAVEIPTSSFSEQGIATSTSSNPMHTMNHNSIVNRRRNNTNRPPSPDQLESQASADTSTLSHDEQISQSECPIRIQGHEPNVVGKDNDINDRLLMHPDTAADVLDQLERDSSFLRDHGLMDYSLLLGVHYEEYDVQSLPQRLDKKSWLDDLDGQRRQSSDCRRDASISIGPSFYYMAIIDTLQDWNLSKMAEAFTKTKLLFKDPLGISAIEPVLYQRRFMERMREMIHVDGNASRFCLDPLATPTTSIATTTTSEEERTEEKQQARLPEPPRDMTPRDIAPSLERL